MKAIWNNMVIAESDDTIVIEKNYYFPPDSVRMEFMSKSDAAWYYPDPKEAAEHIKGYIAFWKGVEITGS
jgi:uncharacterized protein (DUF427 family)